MLTLERILTREAFARLEPEWDALLVQSAADTITLTFDWLSTWWDVFGEDRELMILIARDSGGELIGIAPLLKRTVQHFGVLPFKRLEFIASGEDEADEICSEYLDFIIKQGREAEVLGAMLEHLISQDSEWDEMVLTDILEESPSISILRNACEDAAMSWRILKTQHCIFLPLPRTWDEFLKGLSRGYRHKITRDWRAASSLDTELVVVDKPDDFADGFDTLVRLHQSRWIEKGRPGVFSSEKFTRFHTRLAAKLLPKGRLRIFILNLNGEPLAALYDFIYGRKVFYYQSGLKIADTPIHSPGILIRSYAMEVAIEEKLTECDFMKGDPAGYKSGWQGKLRGILQVRLARAQSKEAIYNTTSKVIAGLRSIKRAVS